MMIGFSDGSPSQYQRIHELLVSYYPLWKDEFIVETSAALEQAMADKENPTHQKKWALYLRSVKVRAKGTLRFSPSQFYTVGMPSLGGVFTLKREKAGRVVYYRKFKIYLSLIGKFYTMFGQDEVFVELNDQAEHGADVVFDPVPYPTPYDIYERWFYLIRETIAEAYPEHEFVPYRTLKYRMKDISTGYSGREGGAQSLFQALFSAEDINYYRTMTDVNRYPFESGDFG